MIRRKLLSELIRKHGKDRYPNVLLAMPKLTEEIGELNGAYLKHITGYCVCGGGAFTKCPKIRKELADVAFVIEGVAEKLGLDIDECMAEVLENETRVFRS